MPPLGFSPELDEGTTSRQFFVSCTGFLSRDVSTSSWYVSFTCLCPSTSVLGWRHTLGFGRSKTSTPLVHRQIVCCSTDAQHIWRQKLCCRRATSFEQPPNIHLRDEDISYNSFRRELKRGWLVHTGDYGRRSSCGDKLLSLFSATICRRSQRL